MTQDASKLLGTWKLRSYEREDIATGRRHDQFGEKPDGYLGYSPDGVRATMGQLGDDGTVEELLRNALRVLAGSR